MATYRVTSPDGAQWDINAPEGATEDAVMRYARAQWGQQSKKPDYEKPSFPQEKFEEPSTLDNIRAGVGKSFVDPVRGVGQMLGVNSQADIDEAKRLDAPLMDTNAGMAGNIAGNLALAVAPGGVAANTLKGATAIGATLAATQPVAGVTDGEFWGQKAKETAIGGAAGAAGVGLAKGLGWVKEAAATKASAIAAKVQAKAAEDAAAATASARSLAGRTAQDAYKQLEHIRELNAAGKLTPEQTAIAKQLTEELAGKAQEKLIPAAAIKQEAAQAYREAMATEAERAAKLAAEKLSGSEAKAQAMARLKRYGPAAVGGVIGNALFPGMGAVGGAATGLVLRPAIHSMRRLAQNPAVQYRALSPLGQSGLLGDLSDPRLLGLLGPSIYAAQE